ncbi:MAG: helix-turn-helix transcriptional regulator [Clostridia bacterium]|nr:helix-turn-helix transcriptional regulator [Clostridia bacterium]
MYIPTPFGVMLKQSRENAKLSQGELAAELHKTAQYISNIEKGKNNSPPDDNDLLILIRKLSLSGEEAEKFRLLAYADRGMLPPEMFRYVLDRPALIGLINYALSNGVSEEYWISVLQNTTTEKGWIHNE